MKEDSFESFKIVKGDDVEYIGARRVVKSNKIVESRQKFSLTQQRAIILAIAQIKPTDEQLKPLKVKIADILALPDGKKISGAQYQQVREEIMKLTNSSIDIIKNDQSWVSYGFISQVKKEERENFITIKFNEDIKPFLLNLKSTYTSYFVLSVENFRKVHSIRIYELCKQYLKIGSRKIEYQFLLDMLYLKKSKLYQKYGRFNENVLKPCIKEINETSDIFVEYEPVKDGRKVTHIYLKTRLKPHSMEEKYERMRLLKSKERKSIQTTSNEDTLKQAPLSLDTAYVRTNVAESKDKVTKKPAAIVQNVYDKLTQKYTKEKVDFVYELISERDDISNPSGYLIKALREGYFDDQFEVANMQRSQASDAIQTSRFEYQDKKDQINIAYDQFRKNLLRRYYENASDEDLEEFIFTYEESENTMEKRYAQEYIDSSPSPYAKNFFATWLIENHGSDDDKLMLNVKHYAKIEYDFEW
ncbi:hypothetical protein AUTU_43610 (plasmid) [Aureibacter tunicatorum]|nr:hypothetical protein AUTU_43610 [Aureibacter tunicatorum]